MSDWIDDIDESDFVSPADQRKAKLLEGLTPEQLQSVEHRGTPLVILAGAGTGKTTALTRRIGHIIASGDARPDEILAVTFTNKAARELETRLKRLLDDDLTGLAVGTFHSICARILRDNYALFDIKQDYVILDSDDQKRLVKRLAKEVYQQKVEAEVISELMDYLEHVRGNPDRKEEAIKRAEPAFQEIYHRYQAAKEADGVLDFTDLIAIVTEAFHEGRVNPQEIAGHWKHILVDEYQDTNGLQFTWLRHIAGDNPNLAVVGDDDQVLYSWRGARIENILDFAQYYPGTEVIRLEQNFRSTGHILDAANGLIAKNERRLGKTLFTDEEQGKKVHVRTFVNAEMEARWVVDEVKAIIAKGTPATDIAILCRASHVLNLIENKMTFAGIPYVLSGGKRFQDKMEIRDAIAYLRLAANPDDTNAFERVVNTPKRGMGDVAVKKIIDAVDKARAVNAGISLIDIARNYTVGKSLPGDVPAKLKPFIDAIENANRMFWSGHTAAEVMEQVLTESGYFDDLQFQLREAKDNEEGAIVETTQHRIDNIRDLITLGQDMTPLKLIEHLGLAEDGRSKKATGVWIGTIHASKGLEWPYVIGVGWEDNVLPSWQALAEGGETLAEERRCGYVEITRARRNLTLTTTGERFQKPAIRSRFLNELPEGSYEEFNIEPDEEVEN